MVADLNIPVQIVIAETVREVDGLAMSSRNAYLDGHERARAPVLYRALSAGRDIIERSCSTSLSDSPSSSFSQPRDAIPREEVEDVEVHVCIITVVRYCAPR